MINKLVGILSSFHPRISAVMAILICLFPRLLFVLFSGCDHYELNTDSVWIQALSSKAAQGNFDFDIGRFVVAPFYQIYSAIHHLVFPHSWEWAIVFSQTIISAVSGLALYRLAELLFNRSVAVLTLLLYAFFPMTLYWTGTLSSESLFTSLFIFSIFFLVKFQLSRRLKHLVYSACFFSLAYLTKSHILLFAPLLVVWLYQTRKDARTWWRDATLYGAIALVFSLPYGLWSLRHYDTFILSSNGSKFHYYTGNSEFGYRAIVDVPPAESEGFKALQQLDFAYYNGAEYDSIIAKPVSERQALFLKSSLKWSEEHLPEVLQLKAYNAAFFILPGVSFRHYSFKAWLVVFCISLPIYLLAYYAMLKILLLRRKDHYYVLWIFVSMLIFSVVFYVQNRFRTITLEPFFLMYASSVFLGYWKKNEHTEQTIGQS